MEAADKKAAPAPAGTASSSGAAGLIIGDGLPVAVHLPIVVPVRHGILPRVGWVNCAPRRCGLTGPLRAAGASLPHPRTMPCGPSDRLVRLTRYRWTGSATRGRSARPTWARPVRQERASPSQWSHENVGTGRPQGDPRASPRRRKSLTDEWFRRRRRRCIRRHEACLWRERRDRPQDEGTEPGRRKRKAVGAWERCLANLSARQHRRSFSLPPSTPGIPGPPESGPTSDPPAAPAPRSRTEPGAAGAAASPPNPPRPGSHR